MELIVIVEDNPSIRELLEASLKNDYKVHLFDSAEKCLENIDNLKPNLFILDINLPGMSGLELCASIKNNNNFLRVPVIFLTAKIGSASRLTGYELGASNYIEKPFEVAELKAIVKSTINSHSNKVETIEIGNLEFDLPRQRLNIDGHPIDLTSSEYRVLVAMVKKPEIIFSRTNLLEFIGPDKLEITDRTIDNYISSIRKKIKISQVAIKTVYGEGYKIIVKKD